MEKLILAGARVPGCQGAKLELAMRIALGADHAGFPLKDSLKRTLDEIGAWSRMAGPAKRAVWALIAQRAQTLDTP